MYAHDHINLLGGAEIDNRLRGLLRFHGLQHFADGILTISQWTCNEAKALERMFVPIMAGSLPVGAGQATQVLFEFFFCMHLLQLDKDDLCQMQVDLKTFHVNKEAFRIYGGYKSGLGWNGISKLHMLWHFVEQILEFGTMDGYTTETTESLHKYLVKEPFRQTGSAGNQTKQMLVWCQQTQAWNMACSQLEQAGVLPKRKLWDNDCDFGEECKYGVVDMEEVEIGTRGEYKCPLPMNNVQLRAKEPAVYHPTPKVVIAKHPTIPSRKLEDVPQEQEAADLWDTLQTYVDTIELDLTYQLNPTFKIGTWLYFKLTHPPLPFAPLVGSLVDFVQATPA